MGILFKLKLLIWRNYIIRKRQWFLTLLEIAIPVMLYMLRPLIFPTKLMSEPMTTKYSPLYTKEDIYKLFDRRIFILYAPMKKNTPLYMKNVQMLLGINMSHIEGFKTVDLLNTHLTENQSTFKIVTVVFNLENTNIFSYVITPKNLNDNWNLFGLFSTSIVKRNQGSYIYFLPLQMALDSSYLSIEQNKSINVTLQEFPQYGDVFSFSEIFSNEYAAITVISYIFLCPNLVQRIVEDKRSGITELMKIMGLQWWLLWIGWLLHTFMVNIISSVLIVVYLKTSVGRYTYSLTECSSFPLLLTFLLLYNVAAISFCLAISSMFYNPVLGETIGLVVWLSSYFWPVTVMQRTAHIGKLKKIFLSILPNVALQFGYEGIFYLEYRKIGLNWTTINENPTGSSADISILWVFIMLMIDVMLYLCMALYLEKVFPGPYGIPKSFCFLCEKLYNYLFPLKNQIDSNADEFQDFCKVEEVHLFPVGIRIKNVYKLFGSSEAVSNVSFDIYKGQITGLLGHNGAGKSVIMSIIAGSCQATSGQIVIFGNNIVNDINLIRESFGVCLQHNLLFSKLTVIEHLLFFGMLKRRSKKDAYKEACSLLYHFNFYQQKDLFVYQLSSGMKRKLSISIALIGGPKVILLDDPTSGLDPESRQLVWDKVLELRDSRVIVFSTRCMEEANILGDRIAILNEGRLVCYGSSTFLKDEYGNEYQLVVTFDCKKRNTAYRKEFISIIRGIIPNAKLNYDGREELTFLLPREDEQLLHKVLKTLENTLDKFGIIKMKFCYSGLEEVYFRINNILSEEFIPIIGTENVKKRNVLDVPIETLKGYEKTMSQFKVLLKKRYWIEKRNLRMNVYQILSVLLLTLLTLYCSDIKTKLWSLLDLSFELRKSSKIYYSLTDASSELKNLEVQYRKLLSKYTNNIKKVGNIYEAFLAEAKKNIVFYNCHMVVAAQFNKTINGDVVINALYTGNAIQSPIISYTLALNAAVKALVNSNISIEFSSSTIQKLVGTKRQIGEHWYFIFSSAILCYSGRFLIFPVMEKMVNIKHLQIMSGLQARLYWIANFIWDFIVFLLVVLSVLFVIALYGILQMPVLYGTEEIKMLFFVLMAYGCSIILFSYIASYLYEDTYTVFSYLLVNLFLGLVLTNTVLFLIKSTGHRLIYDVLNLLPQYALYMSIYKFHHKVNLNYFCNNSIHFDVKQNCERASYNYDKRGMRPNILFVFFSTVLYVIVLIVLETAITVKLRKNTVTDSNTNETHNMNEENEIEIESQTISNISQLEKESTTETYLTDQETDTILLHNITKLIKRKLILNHISFGVKPRKCLSILGSNGSGKSMIFRVITRDCLKTRGEARIYYDQKLFYVSSKSSEYLNVIGYCPQYDPIIDDLTGRETFYMFAKIRGINDGTTELIRTWIKILGLEEISDTLCKEYSNGDKRKLSIGIALIGSPIVLLLDEPTLGIDPESSRIIWNILNLILKQPNSPCMIISSQNIAECETLCDSVCIIETGRMKYFGKLSDLKHKYGKGYTIKLKLNLCVKSNLDNISERFTSLTYITALFYTSEDKRVIHLLSDIALIHRGEYILKHKYISSLHYHTQERKKWSEIYTDVEELKQSHPIIEDYQISDTSLEDLFLTVIQHT